MSNNLFIKNARLIYKNFSGVGSDYNREGDRNVCVIIDDPELADMLSSDGWNVKMTNDEDNPEAYIKVNMSYKYQAPEVKVVNKRTTVSYDEDMVGQLDHMQIETADILIQPSRYTMHGREGISGYCLKLRVKIADDPFDEMVFTDLLDDVQSSIMSLIDDYVDDLPVAASGYEKVREEILAEFNKLR